MWVLLSYKMPKEPTRHRMAVWRRLRAIGAIYLQNGVCLLPANPDHLRQIKMLEHDIIEMKGEVILLEVAPLDPAQEEHVIARFRSDRDEAFREFIERCDGFEEEITRETAAGKLTYAELEENDEDFKKLKVWFGKITALDFYGASLAVEARSRLEQCETRLERFSHEVFDAHQAQNGRSGDGTP